MFSQRNFLNGLLKPPLKMIAEEMDDKINLWRIFHYFDDEEENEERRYIGYLHISELQDIEAQLSRGYSLNDLILYGKTSLEVPVKETSSIRVSRRDNDIFTIDKHGYRLSISKPSILYLYAILCYSAVSSEFYIDIGMVAHRIPDATVSNMDEFIDLLRFTTAKVVSNKPNDLVVYKHMVHSFLFNISYNMGVNFSITDYRDEKRSLRRFGKREGQLFPYKYYNVEITRYYIQGRSINIPFTQYLAFYHVAEFFFQTIAEQDAFQEIENIITRPSFSPYKKEHIREFYNAVKKKMRAQREDGVWDEKTGLLLCLKKHIPNLQNFKATIHTIDETSINYYRNNPVEFADEGCPINFDEEPEKIYNALRNRVYAVRNAIVHSKDGEKLRYEPFRHDKPLAKEIPLIRSIAEEIIINSAKPINYDQ